MAEKVVESAWKVWRVLGEMGRLNLWEARAILGETRDFTCDVLLWLASRGKIEYSPTDDQLFITLTKEEREAYARTTGTSWFLATAASAV